MLASLLAPVLCKEPRDLFYLQGYFLIPTVLSFGMIFCVRSEGIYPSDKVYYKYLIFRHLAADMSVKDRCRILFCNSKVSKPYLLVSFVLTYGVSLFCVVLTLMVQFLCSTGYKNTFSSLICVPAMICTGLAASIGLSFFIDGTRLDFRNSVFIVLALP